MEGKVWLVGAGPGDAGLLTVKAGQVLKDADVLVYDHLAGRDILAQYETGKELINVGKKAGCHPVPQEEINEILVKEARKGKKVVRLKGGDSFLFGRGGEELERLAAEGIPFEVVPGITSALAVPAYSGIPVTHRDYASSLHIVTGHARKGKENRIQYRALVEAGGTLVFLMSVQTLPEIMAGLIEGGMCADMPAAVLQEGTTARQRKVVATVSTLAEAAEAAGIKAPALTVVGRVCQLADTLGWYEKLPLMGMRVLLTRPKELISSTAEMLRRKGAEVLEVPAIETVPIEGALQELFCMPDAGPGQYEWIVFTSQVGVRVFFEELKTVHTDIRSLSGVKFAVIGKGTEKALACHGIYADVIPEIYDGEHLGAALAGQDIQGKKILIPRAEKGNQELVPILEKAGAAVTDLPVYRTVYHCASGVSIKEEIENGRIDCVVFTSSSTVDGFAAAAGDVDFGKIRAACIGRQTARTAAGYGMQYETADQATMESLTELVERMKDTDDRHD